MATTQPEAEMLPPVVELTPGESWAHFDGIAQAQLGMSGEVFLRRLEAGEFEDVVDDPANHPWVGYLAQIRPSVR